MLRVGAPFSKKSTTVFHTRTLECTSGAVEHCVEVTTLQKELAQADRGVVGVRQEGVLDNHAATTPCFKHLDKVLEKQECRLAGTYGEVLLHFLPFLATKGRIGHYHFDAVFFLNVGEVFGEGVGVDDVGRLDAMQDHVHDGDDVGEGGPAWH